MIQQSFSPGCKKIKKLNLTALHDDVPLGAVDFLPADGVRGGVAEVDELCLGVKVQSPGVVQVLNGNDVLIIYTCMQVHASDDPGPTFTIHQEELMLWFCERRKAYLITATPS